jgi:gamma-glutamylcyclotransferase (GGCT)/AIG2-like uncharacterized protein YtfP
MHLFTYGSLMYPQVWSRVMQRLHASRPATLAGYSRRQLPGEVHPAMIPSGPDSTIEGVLYADLTPDELARLDRFEDEGIDYKRISVTVETASGQVDAFTYMYMHPDRVSAAPWDPTDFETAGLQHFLNNYVRQRE